MVGYYHEFRRLIPDVPVAFIGLHDEPKKVTRAEGRKETVQKTLNEFLSFGVKTRLKYYSDIEEIIQEISEINSH